MLDGGERAEVLRFQYTPDDCFQAIVDSAISLCADELREWLRAGKPESLEPNLVAELGDWFEPSRLLTAFDRLLKCHRAAERFALNDWHYLILYHVLYDFVRVHNDLMSETGPRDVGRCLVVGKIDFDAIIEIFFWDTDFLTDPDVFNGIPKQLRSGGDLSLEWATEQGLNLDEVTVFGFSDELFGIVNRLMPHPDELELVRVGEESPSEPVGPLFKAGQGNPYDEDE